MLGFAWFYSSESGLFKGLQRIQIKKIFSGFDSPSGLCAKCLRRALLSSPRKAAASRRSILGDKTL
jgi:hypothetical protein